MNVGRGEGIPDCIGLPHYRPAKLTPTDRERLVTGYFEKKEESDGLTVSEYARSVCGEYGVTAAYVRQLVADRLKNPY